MKNHIIIKIILTFFLSSLTFSCAKKDNNIDFDFTTLKKPKKNKVLDKENKNENKIILDNKIYIKDLVPLKNKEEVLSKTKFGKKDPFSEGKIQSNKLYKDFKLTGFLNAENNNYFFVRYLDNEGTITKDSIGGVNTNLLPKGANVINIDSKNMKLIINYNNENFIFEM